MGMPLGNLKVALFLPNSEAGAASSQKRHFLRFWRQGPLDSHTRALA